MWCRDVLKNVLTYEAREEEAIILNPNGIVPVPTVLLRSSSRVTFNSFYEGYLAVLIDSNDALVAYLQP